jgi:isopentenyl-diphosphate Delta-isomerase
VADKIAVHHDRTPLHLAFSCYVFNPAGQFLLTRRADSKRVFPGVWTNSCCGHPAPGEAMPDAIRRRTRQELGITLGGLRLILPGFRYQARMDGVLENELCPVYAGYADGPLDPDPAEVADVKWVDWADFSRQVVSGQQPISPWCALQVAELAGLGTSPLDWPPAPEAGLPPAARLSTACRRLIPRSYLRPPHDLHTVLHSVGLTQCGVGHFSGRRGARPRPRSSSRSSSTSGGTWPPAVQSAQRMPIKFPIPV